MSEPIPESIPTSADRRSKRPVKKRALDPQSKHLSSIEALFAHPDKPIHVPDSTTVAVRKAQLQPPAPPEIVANVQGSSAGAGSGEFHVYKASRRREYERVRLMEEELVKEQKDHEWKSRLEQVRKKDETKTNRNKARRQKSKARKEKTKQDAAAKTDTDEGDDRIGPAPSKVKAVPGKDSQTSSGGKDLNGGEVKAVEEVGIVIHDDD